MQTIDIAERMETNGGLKAFIMTLRPRRSADPRVAYGFCAVLGVFWFIAGLFFTISMGGWPLLGFFGAEFIFIAGMVHIFIRRTEVVETIEITADAVHITRRDLSGQQTKDFPAYWAQVSFSGSPTENAALEIRSHGDAVEIGRFLSASEKNRTADQIQDVLRRLKSAPTP
ncbi:DUF2244 domain-containing protein [Magnetovibrio sp.]|uniref:DUF2244 domain-containing protein n=1 Tax=Magnetovibrio sp. TaxID=2024836 RepID=UPI002F92641A